MKCGFCAQDAVACIEHTEGTDDVCAWHYDDFEGEIIEITKWYPPTKWPEID